MEKISTRRRLKYGAKRVVAVSRQCWWRSIWRPHCPLPTLHSRERNAQAHTELGRTRGYHDRFVSAPSSSSTEESRRWTLRSSPQPSSLIRVTKSFSNCVYRVHVRHKSPPSRFRPMDGNGTKRNETERNGTERNGTERNDRSGRPLSGGGISRRFGWRQPRIFRTLRFVSPAREPPPGGAADLRY